MAARRFFPLIPAVLLASPLTAQGRPIELGIDGAVEVSESQDLTTTAIGIPVQTLRVGFSLSDRVSLEPRLSFTHVSVEGSGSTVVIPTLGLVYNLVTDPARTRPFIRPFVAAIATSGTGQGIVGGAIGVREPVATRLAARLELQAAYGIKSDNRPSLFSVAVLFGVSFFTK
jgi:hypothetical protein